MIPKRAVRVFRISNDTTGHFAHFASQTMKAMYDMKPTTSIAIICPLDQVLVELDASVIGTRSSERPALKSISPIGSSCCKIFK